MNFDKKKNRFRKLVPTSQLLDIHPTVDYDIAQQFTFSRSQQKCFKDCSFEQTKFQYQQKQKRRKFKTISSMQKQQEDKQLSNQAKTGLVFKNKSFYSQKVNKKQKIVFDLIAQFKNQTVKIIQSTQFSDIQVNNMLDQQKQQNEEQLQILSLQTKKSATKLIVIFIKRLVSQLNSQTFNIIQKNSKILHKESNNQTVFQLIESQENKIQQFCQKQTQRRNIFDVSKFLASA